MAATGSAISENDFRNALQTALTRRDGVYSEYASFHFRWADDDTNADRDAENFRELAKLLSFPPPKEHVIDKQDLLPSHNLTGGVIPLVHPLPSSGRRVVMIHYAGYGEDNAAGLQLISRGGKRISVDRWMEEWVANSDFIEVDDPIDFVFIFDCCCHNFQATRQPNPATRLVDILASGDRRDPGAFADGNTLSLTAKLLGEIRNRTQRGEKFIQIAEVMDTLHQNSMVKKPTYSAKIGVGSITLPLNQQGLGQSANPPPSAAMPKGLLATFSVHVKETLSPGELSGLMQWISQIPESANIGLKLENVKRTNSTVLFFESARVFYFLLMGLPGFCLICENKHVDFSWLLQSNAPEKFVNEIKEGGGERSTFSETRAP
ncbi:hypothetical protein FQN53_005805 [Emmonsiellopsis sp. PD_33]|nr:hypothetical protein FQN53_005805 [Emmonsiellopsis sp. PD_33]